MTLVRDEAAMLPRWLDYYGGQLGYDNLIVFDDNSVDGSTDNLPCTVHHMPPLEISRVPFLQAWMDLMSGTASGLLSWYDVVVFTDVDEFIVPDPDKFDGLRGFLEARADQDVVGSLGLNVVHHAATEPAIDTTKPLLGQRSYAKFTPLMCKPSIKRVPAEWTAGTHGIRAPFTVDPDLFMLHLKFYDRDELRRIAEHRNALVAADGRASGSSWSKSADDMVEALDRAFDGVDLAAVPEFQPASVDVSSLVITDPRDGYRTPKQGQVQALATQPLVRVPERILSLV